MSRELQCVGTREERSYRLDGEDGLDRDTYPLRRRERGVDRAKKLGMPHVTAQAYEGGIILPIFTFCTWR